ncbi:unnamed protein product [Ectocarpus sp. 6 AP-2014]
MAPATSTTSEQQAPGKRPAMPPSFAASSLLVPSVFWFLGVVVGKASGWKECSVSPEDKWSPAPSRTSTAALRMRFDYERRYTCDSKHASYLAASYYFDSPCTARRFPSPPDVTSCLKGRRVIFLGDSLSNQQGDSLMGMLGWHPDWMTKGAPRNSKMDIKDGSRYWTLVDCYHPSIGRIQRCYDYSTSDFPPPAASDHPVSREKSRKKKSIRAGATSSEKLKLSMRGRTTTAIKTAQTKGTRGLEHKRHKIQRHGRWWWWGEGHGQAEEEEEEEEEEELEEEEEAEEDEVEGCGETFDVDGNEIWVHMRMLSRPSGEHWLLKAASDFNETRASDVFVVNFGGHYHDIPEDDEEFKTDMIPVLQDMAVLGQNATVIWREIAPTHFPAANGSYDSYADLEAKDLTPRCTGTPPKVFDRNEWVENYVRDNGLEDRIKLLRIYDMSVPRGAAHQTCHFAPPSTMKQPRMKNDGRGAASGPIDCRHWSETGVVEEWNTLMLNHLCPIEIE